MSDYKVFGLTDKGVVRANNEDYIGYVEDGGLYVVSDGMGGYKAGEVASRIVVDTALDDFKMSKELLVQDDIYKYFYETVKKSGAEIKDYALKDASLKGMGATVCMLYLKSGKYYAAWAGDSRIYLIRDNLITSITEDHSLVYQMYKKGELKYDDIMHHPASNIVTKAIGNNLSTAPDVKEGDILKRDKFLLCSDGLTGELYDKEILEIVQNNEIEKVCKMLIHEANNRRGKDNISVIIVDISG